MSTKIDGFSPTPRVASSDLGATRSAKPSKDGSVAATAPVDTIELTATAGDLRSLEKALAQVPVADHGRIDSIRAAIADGSFRIDSRRIADAMLDLDASLPK